MKSLSQSEYGELRSLYESVYAPKVETILEDFTDEDLDLTDQEIEEQVEEVFLECIEEGYDIDEIERAICEAVDAELQVLNEVTSPAKVAALRMKNKSAAASGEGSGDAGAKARAKLNVSKQKIGGSSEKKASTLSKVKSAASKVKSGLKAAGKVAQGTVGVAARAVGTAQRAASAVKGAAKKGYERGRYGAGGKSSSSSSSSSDGGSSSGGGSSSSSSSSSGGSSSASGESSSSGSSDAPKKRKDGLLKRAIKKVVRGVSKGVSAAAGAVKAGADSITDRARKEQMNYKDFKTIQELYNGIYEPQQVNEENVEELLSEELEIKALEASGLFSEKEIEAIMGAEMNEALTGERLKKAVKKSGGMAYTRKVSADPAKRATRGGRGGESDFGAGDRGTGNKSRRRRGLPVGDED